MNTIRRGYELKFLFFNRPIRPFHLAITISTLALAISNLDAQGPVLTGKFALWVGFWSLITSLFLFVGWFKTNEWFAEWGLLLAIGVWTTRATFAIITFGSTPREHPWFAVGISIAWAVGAGGAYLLERYDHIMEEDECE